MKRFGIYGITVTALTAALSACGGGNSDGSSPRNVSGLWQGAITRVTDTCGGANATLSISHAVSQNQGAVELNDNLGVRYLGNVVGEDGFSVDGAHPASADCSDAIQVEYNDINEDGDETASVDFKVTRTCTGKSDCRVEYTGTAARSVPATPSPGETPNSQIPPPGQTNPVTGGCASMNPVPASGEYSGDGGCGISSAAFKFTSAARDTIILEPFGANGATSFAIAGAGSPAANSSRTDLTVKGEAGYSCSLACSPPGTFTATCFKEGGTTCVEKF